MVSALSFDLEGGVGSPSYQWYDSSGLISGATSSSYTPMVDEVGSNTYWCLVTQEGANCSVETSSATVDVLAAPRFAQQPSAQTLCRGGSPAPLEASLPLVLERHLINGTQAQKGSGEMPSRYLMGKVRHSFHPPKCRGELLRRRLNLTKVGAADFYLISSPSSSTAWIRGSICQSGNLC